MSVTVKNDNYKLRGKMTTHSFPFFGCVHAHSDVLVSIEFDISFILLGLIYSVLELVSAP